MNKYIKGFGFYAVLLAVIFVIYYMLNFSAKPNTIEFDKLINDIKDSKVTELTIVENNAEIKLKDGTKAECYIPSITILTNPRTPLAFAGLLKSYLTV